MIIFKSYTLAMQTWQNMQRNVWFYLEWSGGWWWKILKQESWMD